MEVRTCAVRAQGWPSVGGGSRRRERAAVLRGSVSLALWGGVFGLRLETAGIVPATDRPRTVIEYATQRAVSPPRH